VKSGAYLMPSGGKETASGRRRRGRAPVQEIVMATVMGDVHDIGITSASCSSKP
jgi:cobalamin-dependent methionine synthase I